MGASKGLPWVGLRDGVPDGALSIVTEVSNGNLLRLTTRWEQTDPRHLAVASGGHKGVAVKMPFSAISAAIRH
jgi:hypothetical protein